MNAAEVWDGLRVLVPFGFGSVLSYGFWVFLGFGFCLLGRYIFCMFWCVTELSFGPISSVFCLGTCRSQVFDSWPKLWSVATGFLDIWRKVVFLQGLWL